MFEGFTQRRIKLADVEIQCAVGGAGPPVLLLHGFPQCRAMWARVAPLLAGRFTVVCADLRGYGDSSKPDETEDSANYSFRAMAADQVELMRELGFRQFHLVGHDRGGRTGHRMALDHEEAVKSLVVMDIVPTHAMFMEADRHVALGYWHWYFLSQPAPFPERMIGADPDYFYEASGMRRPSGRGCEARAEQSRVASCYVVIKFMPRSFPRFWMKIREMRVDQAIIGY